MYNVVSVFDMLIIFQLSFSIQFDHLIINFAYLTEIEVVEVAIRSGLPWERNFHSHSHEISRGNSHGFSHVGIPMGFPTWEFPWVFPRGNSHGFPTWEFPYGKPMGIPTWKNHFPFPSHSHGNPGYNTCYNMCYNSVITVL